MKRNVFQSLAKSRGVVPSVWCLALSAVLSVFASGQALAAEFTFKGARIEYENGEYKEITDAESGEKISVLIFRQNGWFKPTKSASGRALLVGGGGAGGYGTTTMMNPGGGGGGGEVVDQPGLSYLANQVHTVTVGAGGAQTTAAGNGENGHPSVVSNATAEVVSALGGGGGGSQNAGNGGDDVATGGGGSGNGKLGGVGSLGEDGKGGKAGATNRAGGGGGAGGSGVDSSSGQVGDGGAGATLEAGVWFPEVLSIAATCGGGGGGGAAAASGNGSGNAGGGDGGRQNVAGGDGTANSGGGGGGGGKGTANNKAPCVGGAGGSGIVVIRFEDVEATITWKPIQVSVGGKTTQIFVDENASYRWQGGDLVIAYSNTTIKGGLRFFDPENPSLLPVWANARVLEVGGGGGGGMINVQSAGGGGGGGAGGFVEAEGLVFDKDFECQVTVGAGGAGGDANEVAGKPGRDSFVTANGAPLIATALGGGGGGAHGAGGDGASGGGGSRANVAEAGVYDRDGGAGVEGQGFAGGKGAGNYSGGGGGGAAGEGVDTTGDAAAGGSGKLCDITGANVAYAGGGGGACVNSSNTTSKKNLGGVGGVGGGGNGAGVDGGVSGTELNSVPAQNGADGLGGGGGGGASYSGAYEVAGNGGNGVVIIRLSNFVVGGVQLPVPQGPFTYDGGAHTGVVEFYAYSLGGTPVATDAGVYTVTATIKPEYPFEWADAEGGKGARTVTWSIEKKTVVVPGEPMSFVYDATVKTPISAARYAVTNGWAWVDGLRYCQLFDHEKTDRGDYTLVAKLNTEGGVTNFVWSSGTTADQSYEWSIEQAPNKIEGFSYGSYLRTRIDAVAKPHHPSKHFTSKWGKDSAVYEYRPVGTEGAGGWEAWPPQKKGSYTLRITVPETPNWQGDVVTKDFGTWDRLADVFTDQMKITVSGNTSGTTELQNFPVPVKVREPVRDGYSAFSGFSYARAGASGKEIRFFDQNGDPIEHEVDIWNTHGESVVWVRVPSLKSTSTWVTMCWRRTDNNIILPEYDARAVWKGYVGVWHFSRQENGEYVDSTGNALDVTVTGGSTVEAVNGVIGQAAFVRSGSLQAPDYSPLLKSIDGPLSFTGTYRGDGYSSGTVMFAGKKPDNSITGKTGWCWMMTAATTARARADYTDTKNTGDLSQKTGLSSIKENWHGFTFEAWMAGETSTQATYIDGNELSSKVETKKLTANALPLLVANSGFVADEVRLSADRRGDTWVKAENASLTMTNFCTYDLVHVDCDRYNNGSGLICDWWTVEPALSATSWKEGGSSYISVTKGVFAAQGATVETVYSNCVTGAKTVALPTVAGTYRATFDHKSDTAGLYRPQAHKIDFYIIEKIDPQRDLGFSSGRVLLMNSDNNVYGPVTNQGWCARDESGVTYWKTLEEADGTNNILPGVSFDLVRGADTNVLWHLVQCRQGSTFPLNDLEDVSKTRKAENFLPGSAKTALSVTNESIAATRSGTGWLMLRNREGASVTSGVFTNGVGTIYFDAVNQKAVVDDSYRLVLEVVSGEDIDDLEAISDDRWRQVEMCAFWYRLSATGTASVDLAPTRELSLREDTGGSDSYFYRIHAQVNEHRPSRIRIRRSGFDEEESNGDESMILLDNLIVSIPPTTAELVPYGKLDLELLGVQVVGQGGAFDPPFPSAGSPAPKGRARVKLPAGCGLAGQSPDSYLSVAQMFYRRRYLGQLEGTGDWLLARMQGAGPDMVETVEPLSVAMTPGDIEYRFVAVMKSPYYQYVDYSTKIRNNDAVTKAGTWTEDSPLKESRYVPVVSDERLGSLGEDWFVRIRRSASDLERAEVEMGGAIKGLYPMELMDDGTWRGLVRIPRDAKEGEACTFKFNGWNRQEPGATEYASNRTSWGSGGAVDELPNNGVLAENGAPTTFKLDHRSGYLEFRIRLGGESKVWSIARAEYQDFNSWNDAHTDGDLFHVNDVLTNGVDDTKMLVKTNDLSQFTLFEAEKDDWNEVFYTADYKTDFTLDVVYDQAPRMPNNYYHGRYISFVHSKLAAQNKESSDAGLAGKLLGQGKGMIDFLGTSTVSPDGIDEISFKTRVGQAATFDGIAYDVGGLVRDNYMFFTQATMSEACSVGGGSLGDMAVGASISLVGYYFPYQGCYEFRVERPYSGTELTMSIRKWHIVAGVMTCDKLVSRRFSNPKPIAWTDETSTKSTDAKGRFGFFISCETQADGTTRIVGGLSSAAKTAGTTGSTYPARAYSEGNFNGLVFVDSSDNFTWGSYGMMSKDCPAQFLMPIVFDQPLATLPATTQITAKKSWYYESKPVTLNGCDDATKFEQCRESIASGRYWALPPMRLENYLANDRAEWVGLRAPTNLSQEVVVQIRKQGNTSEQGWQEVYRGPVSSYSLDNNKVTIPIRRTGRWDVRYKTGASAVDLVFADIKQTQWHAPDDGNILYASEKFTFTQALVLTNTTVRRREMLLQPARADETKPVSVRSPMLNGLGKLTFRYTNADPDAQIWVQVATNGVSATTLSGNAGYNQSLVEGDGVGEWITVKKYGNAMGCDEELGQKGVKTVYLGWHDDGTEEQPHKGVMRLFVPVDVVKKAVALSTNAVGVTTCGQVTLTGLQVTDEPALSERSWRGWNMRTAGDGLDTERRMYLADALLANDIGFGLVGALNNTAEAASLVEGDGVTARACLPTIFSPTFGAEGGGKTGIGAVSFKARVYGRPDEAPPAGRIVIWGASNNVDAKWTVIGTNEIVSTVFSNFTWTTGGNYSAIKFELMSPGYSKGVVDTGRVILDEILISEKVQPSISFDYARPFRMNLGTHSEILDIMSADEQPLAGESWGVQTKLTLKQLENEVDVEKGFRVFLSYYRGSKPWGYEQWKDLPDAVVHQELELVGDKSNLVYRSNIEMPETLVSPAAAGGQVVQFMIVAEYHTSDGGAEAQEQPLTQGMWKQPEWYYPVDLNADNGGDRDDTKFSAYSIIDTVSPGRAWINEVNWNDGLKSETGGYLSKTNQYVEVCVPAGVDMTGWYVKVTGVATDAATGGKKSGKLFTFGKWGVPAKKNTGRAVSGYEFMFVQSPDSLDAGGVKDIFGNPADGTWSDGDQVGMTRGTLSYYQPYQFELFRPSGVLEHQFVLEGTNSASLLSGTMYSGENLVSELNEYEVDTQGYASPKRFFAGVEGARRKSGALWGSAGVTGGTKDGDPAPGADGTWQTGLGFTPGALNEGQVIPEGWFLPPNGTNSWIYASVVGDHLRQRVGEETGRSILIVVPQGGKTNIHYEVDNFYELDAITVNGVTNAAPRHVPHVCDYEIDSPSGTMYVVASEGIDERLLTKWGLGKENRFTPSILNWLGANWPDRDIDEMVPAHYQMVDNNEAAKHELGLNDLYWLDIPPFTESGESEWLLRAGVTGVQHPVVREKYGREYTNLILTVKMYKENDHTFETNRVVKMQGLDDSRSNDPETYDVWDSQTFKIRGAINLNSRFLPFRTFIFDDGSFDEDYQARIEIMDPYSPASPGYSYGWDLHVDTRGSAFWCTTMDTDSQPVTIEMLKADSTYEK